MGFGSSSGEARGAVHRGAEPDRPPLGHHVSMAVKCMLLQIVFVSGIMVVMGYEKSGQALQAGHVNLCEGSAHCTLGFTKKVELLAGTRSCPMVLLSAFDQ